MKKISILIILLLLVCGCDNKEADKTNLNNDSLKEIKESIDNCNKMIEELSAKNKELESKISALESEKEILKETISKLEEKDKEVDKTITNKYNEVSKSITDKYNELSKKISSSNSSTTSKHTITKEQLLGTWNYVVGNSNITFTDENLLVHDNWIEWKGIAFPYLYKNGKLYISDDGVVLQK